MRWLLASLYKDAKLFLTGAGILALLLPFALFAAAFFGFRDLLSTGFVQRFSIAVQDQDETVMSRSLVSQLREIELFQEVRLLSEGEEASDALEDGCAGVLVIPKDFFYAMYTAADCPVEIILNEHGGIQPLLLKSMFSSVMEIASAEQAAARAAYGMYYGESVQERADALYAQSSQLILDRALGRQQLFDTRLALSDMSHVLIRNVLATVFSMLFFCFSLTAVRTIPEEAGLGVLPRFRSIGGKVWAFYLSKFLIVLLLSLPFSLGFVLLFRSRFGLAALLLFLLLLLSFSISLFLAALFRDAARVQQAGNLLLLLSLLFGGSLWPANMLPPALSFLRRISVSYYAYVGIEALYQGTSPQLLFSLLSPALLLSLACLLLSGMLLRVRFLRRAQAAGQGGMRQTAGPISKNICSESNPGKAEKWQADLKAGASSKDQEDAEEAWAGAAGTLAKPRPIPLRLLGMAACKAKLCAGGFPGFLLLLLSALLCALTLRYAESHKDAAARIAVWDADGSALSEELADVLSEKEGVAMLRAAGDPAGMLLDGSCEGALSIPEGYGERIESYGEPVLHYQPASAAASVQAIREIIAGIARTQQSRYDGMRILEGFLERELRQAEKEEFLLRMKEEQEKLPPLYRMAQAEGGQEREIFLPGQLSFFLVFAIQLLLGASQGCGSREARGAARRLRSLPHGSLLSHGSDLLAMLLLGASAALCLLWGSGFSLGLCLSASAFLFCVSALSLLLSSLTAAEGRVDGFAPELAMILCLLGGCFLDLSGISGSFAALSLLSPAGLCLRACSGQPALSLILFAEGMAALALRQSLD